MSFFAFSRYYDGLHGFIRVESRTILGLGLILEWEIGLSSFMMKIVVQGKVVFQRTFQFLYGENGPLSIHYHFVCDCVTARSHIIQTSFF